MNLTKNLLVTSLMLSSLGGYAQCLQKIDLVKDKNADTATHGEFTLKIKSDDFNAQLIQTDGVDQLAVKNFSGSGTTAIVLNKLSKEFTYKVILEFRGEENFLCKRKVVLIPVTDSK